MSELPLTPAAEVVPTEIARRGRVLRRFVANRTAVAGAVFLVIVVLIAVFAPLLAPFDPNKQNLLLRLKPPRHGHWLGTDEFGRDELTRIIYGARVSLIAALEAVAVATVGGIPSGMLAGFTAARMDAVLGRLNDALMSVPALLMALTVIAVLGPGLNTAMLAVGVIFIPRFFRIARAATQDVRHNTYVEASRAIGCTTRRTVLYHVLPNALTPLVVTLAIALGAAVTAEASLSFLGLGVKPPTPSWGSMLGAADSNMVLAPHLVYFPGIMIALTVLAFAMVGDGLAQALGTSRQAVSEGV
ncbi:MAG TPA: ABC transporter permease [Acidimicrobiales bacterium]|nr:ABC transporter permease [Acidimicrobiales bacterium]